MKKILSFVLAFIMMSMPLCVESYASGDDSNYDDLVVPCYDNLSMISAHISEGLLGFVTCTSGFVSYQADRTFVFTCYLQRTDASSGWENYKSKTETYSGKGSYTIEKSWFAPAPYDYRTLTKLQVKNSAGTIIETATIASIVIYK